MNTLRAILRSMASALGVSIMLAIALFIITFMFGGWIWIVFFIGLAWFFLAKVKEKWALKVPIVATVFILCSIITFTRHFPETSGKTFWFFRSADLLTGQAMVDPTNVKLEYMAEAEKNKEEAVFTQQWLQILRTKGRAAADSFKSKNWDKKWEKLEAKKDSASLSSLPDTKTFGFPTQIISRGTYRFWLRPGEKTGIIEINGDKVNIHTSKKFKKIYYDENNHVIDQKARKNNDNYFEQLEILKYQIASTSNSEQEFTLTVE